MAFFSKLGNILRQSAAKQISSEVSPFKLSMSQAVRCMCSMASSKLFIGGISYQTDEQSLREAFAKYGEIVDARIIVDRDTGRSRGFGFVTFTSSEEASSAIQALDGQDLHGRRVRVNYATDRRAGFGGGGGGYGGGGYGGGGYGGGSYGGGGGSYGGGGYSGGGGGYGGGAAGGSYGGSGGGDSFGSGGSYGAGYGGNSVDFGSNAGSYNAAAAGPPGTDNFSGSGSFGGGFDGSAGSSGNAAGFDNSFGDNKPDAPLEGSYRDDDDSNDFAKRA
ncbi:glycine-rich RNA-binding protein blt801-like [Humulus lupulus]|uniref:glycine-rich RNA-binding protein blt801-like n=1 Tax=Humulus lupulus TaxID=3486 RepID=UPI002B4009DE|nr:glycine-rich RNA-binding protein blt801-like [Humulus lupulus]XP_062116713.1 glycine-rich RNA-binding protein blt801-like [Humulus lupulus]XP_062116714.1 glycine-rich RNA-binding protein blt801-like [Humulus lupulus]